MFKKLFILLSVVCFIMVAGRLGKAYWLVVVEPGDEIKIENIHGILGRESHVFYSDGETKLGVFFDTAHRQYVSFNDIPKNFINAMVASEDNRFFTHIGFDIVGIGRAMLKNIQALEPVALPGPWLCTTSGLPDREDIITDPTFRVNSYFNFIFCWPFSSYIG